MGVYHFKINESYKQNDYLHLSVIYFRILIFINIVDKNKDLLLEFINDI